MKHCPYKSILLAEISCRIGISNIEISMFEGRTVAAKKQLIRLLFDRLNKKLGISHLDLEITIFETPKHNWGFRGLPGDEHSLDYQVNV
jgi:phenylpyruvate tautomerase PptA (4-oxalocrotonate tautomerase family)